VGQKNKPYNPKGAPRAVNWKGGARKRRGSSSFSLDILGKTKKGLEGFIGYGTGYNVSKSPHVSEQVRGKNIRAGVKVPIGKGIRIGGNVSRKSRKGKWQEDSPDYQGAGSWKDKSIFSYGADLEAPFLGGTAYLRGTRTPGQPSIRRKRQQALKAGIRWDFNKGGKVTRKKKKNKKKK